ncbi:MAG: dTDP-glucose 4,6-dehydratase [Anaerolineaceae bacterium 4572_32.1]|nr:MAG: dTDP-glucose 4,6-dehydratase [Anaerolineaceae bacterium 4572_32.1]
MKNLLITGGAGFIGSNFVRYMLNKYPDYRLIVFDKLTYAGNLDNLQDIEADFGPRYAFVHGDICDAGAVEEATRRYKIDTIVNFAAETHVDRSLMEAGSFIQTDVFGTYTLLEAVKTYGLERFHQVSTDEVYGDIPPGYSSVETDPLHTRSPYSASKAGGDLMCIAYHTSFDVPVTITRGSNNIGPYQYPEKVVPLFVTNAIDDISLPLYGDGRQMRDYQYMLDHCEGIDLVLHRGQMGEVYNVGSEVETENIVMAQAILDLLDKPYSLIQYVTDRPGHDRRYSLNCDKLKALGWKSAHTFEQAIEKTVRWYVENEWWWRKIKNGEYMDYYRQMYQGREIDPPVDQLG